jgi:hypothetical protein
MNNMNAYMLFPVLIYLCGPHTHTHTHTNTHKHTHTHAGEHHTILDNKAILYEAQYWALMTVGGVAVAYNTAIASRSIKRPSSKLIIL